MAEAIILVVFPFCMFFAAVSDVLSMKINNIVPLLLLGAFLVVAPATGMPAGVIGMHLLAGALLLAVTFALFAFGGMGGGDAKLIAASAVWMGFGPSLINYLMAITLIGGQLTLMILVFRRSPLHHLAHQSRFLRNFAADAKGVPYGIALGAGGVIAYAQSPLMIWALNRLAG
ncbi:MAG: prepilin peptidase [Rhizobiaceae bacterium]|nr:prepilin peptidase [Rhizobiaceae bacterium]